MTINRMVTLAAIFLAATVLLYFSGPHRQLRQTRIFVVDIPNRPDAERAEVRGYFQTACPDMLLIKDQQRADYTLIASWAKGSKWGVFLRRKDQTVIFLGEQSPDAIETFRQTCKAIRDDAKEVSDLDAQTEPMPIGRFSMHSADPEHVFLLDTKTGAVWQLKPDLKNTPEFERISVEGLYKPLFWP
jgi:hypothetical protein